MITEFRNPDQARALLREIERVADGQPMRFMEVCGGHTISFFKFGLRDMLPSNVQMISGPGCPVCVSPQSYIDHVVALARLPETIIVSFGDLVRVPGSSSTLLKEKSRGADVRLSYSPLDALKIAADNPHKRVIFPGIGFETTAPTIASTVRQAHQRGLTNFFVLSSHKTMPGAMELMAQKSALNGFLCPGHVTSITGTAMYQPLARDHNMACVVSGFEPLDILHSVLMLVRQVKAGRAEVENQYHRVVRDEGNPRAMEVMYEVFSERDDEWRGLGVIKASGLGVSDGYRAFDAKQIEVEVERSRPNPGCICGSIMAGKKIPTDCKLFANGCDPEDPAGACMVSDEGTCATYYKYARSERSSA